MNPYKMYESVTYSSNKEFPQYELVIPFGKKAKLVLSDGTKEWLHAETRFAFLYEFIKIRKVFLD